MFRGSKEFPGSVEGTVKFDKEICCALERGFKRNPVVVKELEEIGPNELFADGKQKNAVQIKTRS